MNINSKSKIIMIVAAFALTIGLLVLPAQADEPATPANNKLTYERAVITRIISNTKNTDPNDPDYDMSVQEAQVLFTSGPEQGHDVTASYFPKTQDASQNLKEGEEVYVIRTDDGATVGYNISEPYRLPSRWWLAIAFVLLVVLIGRYKGFGSLLGLAFSFAIIAKYIIPQIMSGHNPLLVCIVGAVAIAFVSIYVAHGFNLRTSLAVISTMATIALAAGIDWLVINLTNLSGAGSEEAVYAQFGQNGIINLRGLLLGGIIVGVLGVLDDITTAQAAVVDELHKANPKLKFKELYAGGLSVGKEHIASLINTLVLAYVGASFPLVLLFQNYQQPLAYIINSEVVSEEIARTLIGGSALILAVPLTTALAAYILGKRPVTAAEHASAEHSHHHH